jgi:hypothetical protein
MKQKWLLLGTVMLFDFILAGLCSAADLVFEAENLTRKTTSGITSSVLSNASYFNGKAVLLQSVKINDYVEVTLPNVPAGTYAIKYYYGGSTTQGMCRASIDGINIGSPADHYSATNTYKVPADSGCKTFGTAGNRLFRLTITGKNLLSYGANAFNVVLDRIVFSPVTLQSISTFEAENVTRSSNVSTAIESDSRYSNGKSVKVSSTAVGNYCQWTLPNIAAGEYFVWFYYKSQNSRAKVQASIDGVNQGAVVDMYSANDAWQVKATLV